MRRVREVLGCVGGNSLLLAAAAHRGLIKVIFRITREEVVRARGNPRVIGARSRDLGDLSLTEVLAVGQLSEERRIKDMRERGLPVVIRPRG